jgi:hypothetical protein
VIAALSHGRGQNNVGVPLLLKNLVDTMNIKATDPKALLVVPVALLLVTACCAVDDAVHRIAAGVSPATEGVAAHLR